MRVFITGGDLDKSYWTVFVDSSGEPVKINSTSNWYIIDTLKYKHINIHSSHCEEAKFRLNNLNSDTIRLNCDFDELDSVFIVNKSRKYVKKVIGRKTPTYAQSYAILNNSNTLFVLLSKEGLKNLDIINKLSFYIVGNNNTFASKMKLEIFNYLGNSIPYNFNELFLYSDPSLKVTETSNIIDSSNCWFDFELNEFRPEQNILIKITAITDSNVFNKLIDTILLRRDYAAKRRRTTLNVEYGPILAFNGRRNTWYLGTLYIRRDTRGSINRHIPPRLRIHGIKLKN